MVLSHFFVSFMMKVHGIQDAGYIVSSLGYIVLYKVSRIRGTWFQEYGVHGFGGTGVQGMGYIVSHYTVSLSGTETGHPGLYQSSAFFSLDANVCVHMDICDPCWLNQLKVGKVLKEKSGILEIFCTIFEISAPIRTDAMLNLWSYRMRTLWCRTL